MSDISDDDNEISFAVKFLGRVEVVRSEGMQVLNEAIQNRKMPDKESSAKVQKKNKVSLFLSMSGIDILEHKTKFMLYTCPLSSVSFCAVIPTTPKVFGFVAKHPAADMYHCYLFQSKKFSHLLVSIIGDAFRATKREESLRGGGRDLIVEALRHKNKILQRENAELRMRLSASGDGTDGAARTTNRHQINLRRSQKKQTEAQKLSHLDMYPHKITFHCSDDTAPLLRTQELNMTDV
ncbi:PTB domain-containing engulfment adapter protein 1-like isoform X1 [Oncorhynchus masou masou]|uniref:PTB domain-containing engulfment adapter protein 1-like isoform X1 n=2 Tax=Oncorhynchus masou masou TaxID=90313 RepID=UPI003182D235